VRQRVQGYVAKQLNVLAALSSGKTNYPQLVSKMPDWTQLESRVKRNLALYQ